MKLQNLFSGENIIIVNMQFAELAQRVVKVKMGSAFLEDRQTTKFQSALANYRIFYLKERKTKNQVHITRH